MTPSDTIDADLARAACAGEQRAFAQLAARHGRSLARTVAAMGVSPSEVEDVVQSALVACWRGLSDYDPARSFLSWASVIAANKARDWARRRRVRRFWLQAADLDRPEALAVADGAAGEDWLGERDQVRRVAAEIARLPDNLRIPLVLVAVTGLKQREVAEQLGLGVRTVESRIAAARAELARRLGIADD